MLVKYNINFQITVDEMTMNQYTLIMLIIESYLSFFQQLIGYGFTNPHVPDCVTTQIYQLEGGGAYETLQYIIRIGTERS